LFFAGIRKIDVKGLTNDLSYNHRKEKYQNIIIPTELTTINLLGIPLGQEKKRKNPTPNDGFSPLADAITDDGIVVVEMGVDHFFKGVDLNCRMAALLKYIVEHQN